MSPHGIAFDVHVHDSSWTIDVPASLRVNGMTALSQAGVIHLIDQTQCGRTMQQATGSVPVARLGTLRDWEQSARRPDSAAKAYLRVIEAAPDAV